MPIWLQVALGAFVAAVPTVLVVVMAAGPLVRRFLDERIAARDVVTLKGAVKGAAAVVASIAKLTPIPYDDALAQILERVSRELEAAHGRPMTAAERSRAVLIAESVLADPARPGIVERGGSGRVVVK